MEATTTFLERSSDQGKLLQTSSLIIIDEMSMLAAWHIDLIDKCLKVSSTVLQRLAKIDMPISQFDVTTLCLFSPHVL